MRVFVSEPFDYNATGYDREETHFSAGEQQVTPRVAEYIERKDLGHVLADDEEAPELSDVDYGDAEKELVVLRDRLEQLENAGLAAADDLKAANDRIAELQAELEKWAGDPDDPSSASGQAIAELEKALKTARDEAFGWRLQAMKADELKAFAAENGYDLGGAGNREDMIAAIKKAAAEAPSE